ncbi:TIGR02281 family clan AA aspartic protease [Thalassotalea sp. PS06]|uniref:retropepsin-like aspartic protease family protein n=1 Tax=Thalassotalea sp. PS06 TaxID=2594005 RepID=UPI0011623ED6|nr:retropepsin-like aspartic protease [Thalassotalea sp. PS06]QDP01063.1 TIGR02281 family clan AA aspartic protease [Thalassotalea sp. PS06]
MKSKLIIYLCGLLVLSVGLNTYQFFSRVEQVHSPITALAESLIVPSYTSSPASEKSSSSSDNSQNNKVRLSLAETPIGEATDGNLQLLIATAEQFFNVRQFDSAADIYADIEIQSEEAATHLKSEWLTQAYQWLEQKQFTLINNLLENFLAYSSNDEDWLLVKINYFEAIDKKQEAVFLYYELIHNSFDYEKEEMWLSQIHQIAEKQRRSFAHNGAWHEQIDFFEPLLMEEPNYPPYILALSQAFIQLEEFDIADSYLDNISHLTAYQGQVAKLRRQMHSTQTELQAIKLNKINEHFLVNARINKQYRTNLMIDTGASITVLSEAYFNALKNSGDIQVNRQLEINTAAGNQTAYSVIVDHFNIGEHQLEDFEIVVMELPGFEKADGLLGMNFLKQFKFEIDQENSLLFLSEP